MTEQRRRTRREKQNADNLKALRLQPCMRCGQTIDYSLAYPHPQSFIAGHIKSWIDYPHLREDPSNLQPEHLRCGTSAHDDHDGGRSRVGTTSRIW